MLQKAQKKTPAPLWDGAIRKEKRNKKAGLEGFVVMMGWIYQVSTQDASQIKVYVGIPDPKNVNVILVVMRNPHLPTSLNWWPFGSSFLPSRGFFFPMAMGRKGSEIQLGLSVSFSNMDLIEMDQKPTDPNDGDFLTIHESRFRIPRTE